MQKGDKHFTLFPHFIKTKTNCFYSRGNKKLLYIVSGETKLFPPAHCIVKLLNNTKDAAEILWIIVRYSVTVNNFSASYCCKQRDVYIVVLPRSMTKTVDYLLPPLHCCDTVQSLKHLLQSTVDLYLYFSS